MDPVQWLYIVLVGVVEGLTEYLPVSSTGHMIVLVDMLQITMPPGRVFEVVIQSGAIAAVVWLYRLRFWNMCVHAWHDAPSRRLLRNMVVATVPAAIIGMAGHEFIKTILFSVPVVATMLILGGVAILIAERYKPKPHLHAPEDIPLRCAFCIGCAQALAVVPGTSRSGATILGSLLLGVERRTAAEFSFLLAVPVLLGASGYDLYKNYAYLNGESWQVIAVGFVAAFITAWFTIRWMLSWISRIGFAPFAWYRIALGLLVWAWLLWK